MIGRWRRSRIVGTWWVYNLFCFSDTETHPHGSMCCFFSPSLLPPPSPRDPSRHRRLLAPETLAGLPLLTRTRPCMKRCVFVLGQTLSLRGSIKRKLENVADVRTGVVRRASFKQQNRTAIPTSLSPLPTRTGRVRARAQQYCGLRLETVEHRARRWSNSIPHSNTAIASSFLRRHPPPTRRCLRWMHRTWFTLIDSFSEGGLKPGKCMGENTLENVDLNYPSRPNVQIVKDLSIAFSAASNLPSHYSTPCAFTYGPWPLRSRTTALPPPARTYHLL